MIFGFNTDIRHEDTIYHVQSEAREAEQSLQTQVFVKGRCIGKRAVPYGSGAAEGKIGSQNIGANSNDQEREKMLRELHREVLDAIRDGKLESIFDRKDTPETLAAVKELDLEWTNADCPYTRKHYASGNMQGMQGLAQKDGIVWLTVISSAPGRQGYVTGPQADFLTESRKATPTAVLLDPSGAVGRLYGAKTTPHMFVIDKNGALQYMGGIDSIATADASDIARAEPYLKEAMMAVAQGNPVAHPVTKPYGCSVKY